MEQMCNWLRSNEYFKLESPNQYKKSENNLSKIRYQLHGFKTCLLGRGFHTLIRNISFPSPTNVGSHNPPPPLQIVSELVTEQCEALVGVGLDPLHSKRILKL